METLGLPSGGTSPKQTPTRRQVANNTARDIWAAVRTGSVHEVEMALAHLKKSNVSIDARNAFGSSPLHIAVWRNHLPIVRRLLAAGADPNVRDGESGWSSLHRALHFGHLAVAGVLIEAAGSLVLEDSKGRTPIDLTSGPLRQSLTGTRNSGAKEVFSWGNGSNYQLGIGITGILRVPGRVDALQGLNVVAVAAAKFHSVALTASGEVYSWGFGRGGRLGHPDFDIHSGQVAVITPRLITGSFGYQGVSVIAVAKHHTIVATKGGEVYTWGSNREGRLGYPSVDTQPTPRRVTTLKARVVAVAAANKHSAVLTESGDVYTWGCNTEGQLGYGTSNSVSNYIPRLVECLKGKKLVAISAAKYHTVVLGAEGEVLTWGYRLVNPHRIPVVRYTKKAGSVPLKFHIAERLHVVAISAGMTHSLALSEDGLVFYWFSADPQLRCRQLLSLAGCQAVAVSSSKYRTAVITSTGDVYSWDGENSKVDTVPVPHRVHGIKHASQLSVGENHSVVVASLFIPDYPDSTVPAIVTSAQSSSPGDEEVDVDLEAEDDLFGAEVISPKKEQMGLHGIPKVPPSLKDLCQRVAALSILEPKNALQILEFADSLGADLLGHQCEELIVRNLDYILTMAPVLFGHVRPSLLARVEKTLDACSTQCWSHRRLPTPTATLPAVIDSEDEDGTLSSIRSVIRQPSILSILDRRSEGFLQHTTENAEAILKQVRAVRKKLQQIDALELKQVNGHILDDQQLAKIQTKRELGQMLASLESGVIPEQVQKVDKQDRMNGIHFVEKTPTVEGTMRSSTGGPKEPRRMAKKRSKGQASSDTLPMERVEPTSREIPVSHPREHGRCSFEEKLLEGSRSVGVRADAPVSSRFVTISGFASDPAKRSEGSSFEQSSSYVGNKLVVKGGLSLDPGLPTLHSPRTRRLITPGPVLLPESPQPQVERKMTTLGKRVVKGGLSVFLSGALDEVAEAVVPPVAPVIPKVEGPVWGGAHVAKRATSLRAIQNQQQMQPKLEFVQAVKVGSGKSSSAVRSALSTKPVALKQADKAHGVEDDPESSGKRLPLSQFVRTSPITVMNCSRSSDAPPDNSPPPWAASTSSPAAPSLRDIQLQQGKSKVQRPAQLRGSPNLTSSIGTMTSSAASGSSVEYNINSVDTPNRWYRPEGDSRSTLRCIQIEEKAMKELRQLYKNVKLVKNDS